MFGLGFPPFLGGMLALEAEIIMVLHDLRVGDTLDQGFLWPLSMLYLLAVTS